ncbi:MAG: hypothetical protein HC820_07465 [Hydrococcus sp. RM1_1_31]|nr:hypothetical protein [Hydrococcus sp. RM1_1_31]
MTNQQNGDAPPCIRVKLTTSVEITDIIESVKNGLGLSIYYPGNAAQQLVDILPNIANWKLQLQNLQGIVPSLYSWQCFDGGQFIECFLPNQTGMYQMWDRGGDRPRLTLFYDAQTDIWRQGDWYGLRFLALYHSQKQCIAHYDAANTRLAIPFSQRWPELYERTLVLASGRLPSYQKTEQNLWLIYENVDRKLAQKLTEKLDVTCKEATTYV